RSSSPSTSARSRMQAWSAIGGMDGGCTTRWHRKRSRHCVTSLATCWTSPKRRSRRRSAAGRERRPVGRPRGRPTGPPPGDTRPFFLCLHTSIEFDMEGTMEGDAIKSAVREKYAQAALRVVAGEGNACCGGAASSGGCDPISANLYDEDQTAVLPEQAVLASLGCGNPTALADLKPGE